MPAATRLRAPTPPPPPPPPPRRQRAHHGAQPQPRRQPVGRRPVHRAGRCVLGRGRRVPVGQGRCEGWEEGRRWAAAGGAAAEQEGPGLPAAVAAAQPPASAARASGGEPRQAARSRVWERRHAVPPVPPQAHGLLAALRLRARHLGAAHPPDQHEPQADAADLARLQAPARQVGRQGARGWPLLRAADARRWLSPPTCLCCPALPAVPQVELQGVSLVVLSFFRDAEAARQLADLVRRACCACAVLCCCLLSCRQCRPRVAVERLQPCLRELPPPAAALHARPAARAAARPPAGRPLRSALSALPARWRRMAASWAPRCAAPRRAATPRTTGPPARPTATSCWTGEGRAAGVCGLCRRAVGAQQRCMPNAASLLARCFLACSPLPLAACAHAACSRRPRSGLDLLPTSSNGLNPLPPPLRSIFTLAKERDLDLDFHTDENGNALARGLRYVARKALQHGYQGRVVCGHCWCARRAWAPARLLPPLGVRAAPAGGQAGGAVQGALPPCPAAASCRP